MNQSINTSSTPDDSTRSRFTLLLEKATAGEVGATDAVFPLVYQELREIAGALMRGERGVTARAIEPTALVHEAYLKLLGGNDVPWENRAHFFGSAARAMRQILIDKARRITRERANFTGASPHSLLDDPTLPTFSGNVSPLVAAEELLALDKAMVTLQEKDERQHEVVMLRFFAGLTIEQTASAMKLSEGTIKNEWTYARAWLQREMAGRG